MSVRLDHTLVLCRDQTRSADFLADTLGLEAPTRFGRFLVVRLTNDVSLDFHDVEGQVVAQHYTFLVSEPEFDEIFERITSRGADYWADPGLRRTREINRNDGGRGVYFLDPDGHLLEILTRPYGSGDLEPS